MIWLFIKREFDEIGKINGNLACKVNELIAFSSGRRGTALAVDEVLLSVFTRLCLLLKENGTDILIYKFFDNYSSTASGPPSLAREG